MPYRLSSALVSEIRQRVSVGAVPMDLAREYRVSASTICDLLMGKTWSEQDRELIVEYLRRRSSEQRELARAHFYCEWCGKRKTAKPSLKRRFCSTRCRAMVLRARYDNPVRHKTDSGHIKLYYWDDASRKKITEFEHRRVWRESGRVIPAGDFVLHHKNEIPDDNRLENLELLTRAEHSRIHRQKDWAPGGKRRVAQ